MASKGSSKRRSQGGGRTANGEPRLQVFRDFAGCNFQLSPLDFDAHNRRNDKTSEQSDLQMNYMVIQNNVDVSDNKTLETRPKLRKLFSLPKSDIDLEDWRYTDALILVDKHLYIGVIHGDWSMGCKLYEYVLPKNRNVDPSENEPREIEVTDLSGHDPFPVWRCFEYVDDKIVGASWGWREAPGDPLKGQTLWVGDYPIDENTGEATGLEEMSNAKKVPDPEKPYVPFGTGSLVIHDSYSEETPHRTAIAIAYINKYGPTRYSELTYFYSNKPVSEWHSGCFAALHGDVPEGYDITAVEIYYTVDNSASLLLAGRTDVLLHETEWNFNWFGYMDSTTMWPVAQLQAPEQNYTEGAPVSYMKVVDQRIYMWGTDSERLYIGGNPGNLLSVSPGTGGGFVDVEPGTNQKIRVVDKYKTQSGNSIVTILCDSPNSTHEQRFNLVENNLTISNEQNMKSWQAEQVAGAVGCKSPHGAVVCEDGLYSVSRYGIALTTMTMEYNSQIKTNYVSDAIKPVFTGLVGRQLRGSTILYVNGVLYFSFGRLGQEEHPFEGPIGLDSTIFCYDIGLKAWWSYTLDELNEDIIALFHIDYDEFEQEGLGIVTDHGIYLLPLTNSKDAYDIVPNKPYSDWSDNRVDFLMETGSLATQQPQQAWCHVTQLEFCFDYFIGDMEITLVGIDPFGRYLKTKKKIHKENPVYDWREFMRVDSKFRDYKIIFEGHADFRMTHFIAKVYTQSNRISLVYGFDDLQATNSHGHNIHPTFHNYNEVKDRLTHNRIAVTP